MRVRPLIHGISSGGVLTLTPWAHARLPIRLDDRPVRSKVQFLSWPSQESAAGPASGNWLFGGSKKTQCWETGAKGACEIRNLPKVDARSTKPVVANFFV